MSRTTAEGNRGGSPSRRLDRILRSIVVGAATVCALAVGQPALANTEVKVTGTVGAHSLVDTKQDPGAFCFDKPVDSGKAYKLIDVSAPLMMAVSGQGNEKVGWSFTVQRQDVSGVSKTSWMNRYTSPTFTSHANSTHGAAFTQKGVKVIVPFAADSGSHSKYRVTALLNVVRLRWRHCAGDGQGSRRLVRRASPDEHWLTAARLLRLALSFSSEPSFRAVERSRASSKA